MGDAYRQDFSLDGFESTEGFTLVENEFDDGSGSPQSGQIVFEAEQGVDDPEVRAAMEAMFAKVAAIEEVTGLQSPYDPGGQFQISQRGDAAGRIAYATVNLPEDIDFTRASEIGDELRDLTPDVEGLRVELGGFLFAEFEQPSAELFGLAFAIIILIVAFGSVLAMGLPVGVALFGIGLGGAFVILASHLIEVPDFAPFVGLMIGLGVGIDYALLVVTRYREQLHAGYDVRESVSIAMDTAGRSVVFAGATVVISLLGMLLMGIGFVGGLGITASVTVAVTVIASLTLLPALLGFAGANIERTKRRGLVAAGFVAVALVGAGLGIPGLIVAGLGLAVVTILLGFFLAPLQREVQHRPPKPRQETTAYRWSRVIQHHPWISAIGATAFLLVLAIPVLNLRLGFSDESNFADDTTTKQAYDLVVDGFGKGSTGPDLPRRRRRRPRPGRGVGRGQRGRLRRLGGGVGPRAPTQRPSRPDRRPVARHPHRRPPGRIDHPARRPPAGRGPAAGRAGRGCRRPRERTRRRQRRHVRLHGRADARSSSGRCSRSRSCC